MATSEYFEYLSFGIKTLDVNVIPHSDTSMVILTFQCHLELKNKTAVKNHHENDQFYNSPRCYI